MTVRPAWQEHADGRDRARLARLVGLSTPWGKLPQSAQNALYGLGGELDARDELDALLVNVAKAAEALETRDESTDPWMHEWDNLLAALAELRAWGESRQ